MIKKLSAASAPGNLLARAEKLLAAEGPARPQLPQEDVLQLVHELQVHQIELEMQNEELRQAQEIITETGNRYADLYDFAPVGYVTLDPRGRIVEVNLTAAGLLGTPRDSLLQKPFILFVAAFDRQAFQAYLKRLPTGGPPQSSELEINPPQGPPAAVSLESLAMVKAGTQVIQYRIAITDITRRRKAEDELRRSEKKFRRLFDKAPLGYQSLDENGIIREVNQAWLDILGYSRQEVIGRWFGDFLPPDSLEMFPDGFACLKGAGEVCNLEFEMVCQDRSRISVSFYGRVAVDHSGGFVRTHCMFEDVTARKRAEEEIVRQSGQLRALAARLAEVDETGRERLARELHDQVCQSLTALGLTLTLLQTQMPRNAAAKLRGRMAEAVALVEQIGETIRDVMAELRPPVLDDYGLLSALRWYAAEFSGKTGIGVDVQGEEVVPRLAAPVELALFRIVQEAMTNVAKHARATGVVLTEAEDNGTVRLVIADNGVGFDPARRGQPGGRHLWGLMTMSERAAAAGGRCRIDSQAGQGTRVVVELSR
jgi:PAS domain S-box-containing protein